jgi:H+/Cl- antiporter ClcA/CBS domain-containing protein
VTSESNHPVEAPADYRPVDRRVITTSVLAVLVALIAALLAEVLIALIAVVTNLAFYGRFSTTPHSPSGTTLGLLVLIVPVIGGLIVGLMARFGSAGIRGHGIPEVMEKVLYGESRIPARMMFLKPVSAAIAIGTGGPFGAEGPIIATGGALGSLVGQIHRATADERKTLLAAGAAAGMAATFGTPVAAVLLAVELLLFEYRARSLIPVALAAVTATAVRAAFHGSEPVFEMSMSSLPSGEALFFYTLLGAFIGLVAAVITRVVYGIEDAFEHLPVHWMWWPAIGAVAVGVIGYFSPHVLGIGYENIEAALTGTIAGRALIMLVIFKFVAWAIYIGSGTSGGTLAPLFTIGGGLGAWVGAIFANVFPFMGIDSRVAGLVGMAAIFAGASHALLASVVFAFETTRQPLGLLPLLAGCTAAYFVSMLFSKTSIMTERLSRRGMGVHTEYAVDYLSRVAIRDVAIKDVVTFDADQTVGEVRALLASGDASLTHQGFPVEDVHGNLVGVVTRRDVIDPTVSPDRLISSVIKQSPKVVYSDTSLRDAADHMVVHHVGRLPVVDRNNPRKVIGIITRSDLLAAHAPRIDEARIRVTGEWRSSL